MECGGFFKEISGGNSLIFMLELVVFVLAVLWLVTWIHDKTKK